MADQRETAQLAAYLRMLKDRAGRSFDALGRRAGVSGSSLHRYCAGNSVPTDFGSLHAFAKVCGATKDEVRELQRLWALADACREAGRTTPEQAEQPEQTEQAGQTEQTGQAEQTGRSTQERDGDFPAAAGYRDDGAAPEPPSETSINLDQTRSGAVPGDDGRAPRRGRTMTVALFAVGAAAVLFAVNAWAVTASGRADSSDSDADGRLLFSAGCGEVISMGEHDECVRETQSLLKDAGAQLAVDGIFGPETLRRVTAFQVLAGLPPKGVVDTATKQALYERKVSMRTWPPAKVKQRIREVFVEDPDRAVAIADCQSYLDPLWVLPNTNGSRNWGVFQISDGRLSEFRATPLQAFDPEWNIQAAHQLWKLRPDFADWPSCARAARISPMPSAPPSTPAAKAP